MQFQNQTAGRPALSELLFQAVTLAGQEAGRRKAALAEIEAEEQADDFAEELTNAPMGYNLAQRHPLLDIALYTHPDTGVSILQVEGTVVGVRGECPHVTFSRFADLEDMESVDAIMDTLFPDAPVDPKYDASFLGVYRTGRDGVNRLLAIYDLDMTREDLNPTYYENWLKDIAENSPAIAFADNREELPKEL